LFLIEAAEKFKHWLTAFSHIQRYGNLGDALAVWLEADAGVEDVAEDYSNFLLMVIVLLTNPQVINGITVGGSGEVLHISEGNNWIDKIGKDVFNRAVTRHRVRRIS